MKLIKKMVNKIRLAYYSWMIDLSYEGFEGARCEDDPEGVKYWDKLYTKYSAKFKKLFDKDH